MNTVLYCSLEPWRLWLTTIRETLSISAQVFNLSFHVHQLTIDCMLLFPTIIWFICVISQNQEIQKYKTQRKSSLKCMRDHFDVDTHAIRIQVDRFIGGK